MLDSQEIIQNPEKVKSNFEYDEQLRKVREEIAKKFVEYRKSILFMAGDAPIETLCLPKVIENALLAHGCLRIYDLFDCNFTEIKGLGISRIRDLTSCLDQFVSML